MLAPRNIVLIGYRGSGKTSVGRQLADRLGWSFVDTDTLIEVAAGRSIAQIFAEEGEPAFRQREETAIAAAARDAQQVLSVGGGAVLRPANRAVLKAAGLCIWLTAPVETLAARIAADPQSLTARPNLTTVGGRAEIAALLAERAPLYASLADHAVETAGRDVNQVVDSIVGWLAQRSADRS